MNNWLLPIIGPLLLYQGRRVRSQTLRLPEPAGARHGLMGDSAKPSKGILILGDSAAVGVGCDTLEESVAGQLVALLSTHFYVEWQLVGKSSLTCQGILELLRATEIRLDEVDTVLISAGVNDVTKGTSPTDWRAALTRLTCYLQQHCHARQIIYTGLPPMHQFPALPQPLRWYLGNRAKQLTDSLKQHCVAYNEVTYLSLNLPFSSDFMARDGFHPSSLAATAWAQEAVGIITKSSR